MNVGEDIIKKRKHPAIAKMSKKSEEEEGDSDEDFEEEDFEGEEEEEEGTSKKRIIKNKEGLSQIDVKHKKKTERDKTCRLRINNGIDRNFIVL